MIRFGFNLIQKLRRWPLYREFILLLSMSIFMLLMGLKFTHQEQFQQTSELKHVRSLVHKTYGLSQTQMGVKRLNQYTINHSILSIYLTIPCDIVCGTGPECIRTCQEQVSNWDPEQHSTPKAKYLILFSENPKSSYYIFRPAIGLIRLLDWSSKPRILTISHRSHSGCCENILLFEAPHSMPNDQELIFKARHQIHSLSAFLPNGKPALSVEDQDEDLQPEWYLYDERFANLTPKPLKLKLPYQLTAHGLELNKRLIRSAPPPLNERRSWIIKHLQMNPDPDGPTPLGLSEPLFIELIKLCIKGHCEIADELALLSYPQSERAQHYWRQLKSYLTKEQELLTK